jgi:hypothetical protein
MAFSSAIKRSLNEALPLGLRYKALLEAIERGHIDYWASWEIIPNKFGVRIGDTLDNDKLQEIAHYLVVERRNWLDLQNKQNGEARTAKFVRGVPKVAADK